MRRFVIAAIATAAVSLVVPAVAQSPLNQDQARKLATDMAAKFDAAYNKHDAAGVASLYAKDATFVPARPALNLGSVVTGRDGIEKFFAGAFNVFGNETTKIIDAEPLGNGALWFVAEVHLSGQAQSGPIHLEGVQGTVLARNGSSWEYRLTTLTPRPTH